MESPMTPHQTPPSVTDEMVERVAKAIRAVMPGGVDVKPLDWQTTYVDRGDGQKEESGWEADNGFNQWYSVETYFGTDSYGWRVMFDCDVIADHDDPERAKAAAQEHFASRILSRLTPSAIGAEGWRPIASAPKTGCQMILFGHWKQFHGTEHEAGSNHVNCGHYANGWVCEGRYDEQFIATHWQPLPAPPTAQENEG
jgi:hypothetical protein